MLFTKADEQFYLVTINGKTSLMHHSNFLAIAWTIKAQAKANK